MIAHNLSFISNNYTSNSIDNILAMADEFVIAKIKPILDSFPNLVYGGNETFENGTTNKYSQYYWNIQGYEHLKLCVLARAVSGNTGFSYVEFHIMNDSQIGVYSSTYLIKLFSTNGKVGTSDGSYSANWSNTYLYSLKDVDNNLVCLMATDTLYSFVIEKSCIVAIGTQNYAFFDADSGATKSNLLTIKPTFTVADKALETVPYIDRDGGEYGVCKKVKCFISDTLKAIRIAIYVNGKKYRSVDSNCYFVEDFD